MKKFLIALGIILGIVIIGVASIVVLQWDNINAVIDYTNSTPEELEQNLVDTKEEMEKVLDTYDLPVVRDFTLEEEKKLMKGELTPQEAVNLLLGENAENSENTTNENVAAQDNNSSVNNSQKTDVDEIIGKYVTQIYGVKAEFLGKLGSIEQKVKKEYLSLDKSQRTTTNKVKIAGKYINEGLSLEGTCDSKINSILSDMEKDLKAVDGDLSVIDTIKTAYDKEKNAKKSYYMGMIK